MTKRATHARCEGRSALDEYRRGVFSKAPALGSLLDNLDAGSTPTFLDILAAISEMVAFYTECDYLESEECVRFFNMSGKKCQNCC